MDNALIEIVADIFDLDEAEVEENMSPDNTDNWDSLNNLKLVSAVESEFNIKFTMEEIGSILTVGQLDAAIKSKLV